MSERKDRRTDLTASVLQNLLPFQVVTFLKEMLEPSSFSRADRERVVEKLMAIYEQYTGQDTRSVTIRQQASHYLAFLKTPQAIQFLERSYEREPNKWVQRGMMVGLALFAHRGDILEHYVERVRRDPQAASINIGYHLVYYGDQGQEEGYYDQGGAQCEKTLLSIFRWLRNERYKNGWMLDLLTLASLIETRGASILTAHPHDVRFLQSFLEARHEEQGSILQQEKLHLETILRKGAFV